MKRIREHDFQGGDKCVHCGDSRSFVEDKGAECIYRDAPAPEPFRRIYAVECFTEIGDRLAEIKSQKNTIITDGDPGDEQMA